MRLSIASWLFLRGVPLDRIFLRPFSGETVRPAGHRVIEGRARNAKRKSIAVLTPYFPYPLSHGGAVRMFNLLRETAREFDVILYAFTEGPTTEAGPVLEFCSRVYLVEKPRYREPRWSTIAPPEVGEYFSPAMVAVVARAGGGCRAGGVHLSGVVRRRRSRRARCDVRSLRADSGAAKNVRRVVGLVAMAALRNAGRKEIFEASS